MNLTTWCLNGMYERLDDDTVVCRVIPFCPGAFSYNSPPSDATKQTWAQWMQSWTLCLNPTTETSPVVDELDVSIGTEGVEDIWEDVENIEMEQW